MRFLFITDSSDIARFVTERGVDRVMVDLEILGKEARQGHIDTLISRHSRARLPEVRAAVPPGRLMIRINPLNPASAGEIDEVVEEGADLIMLPMFRSPDEVAAIADLICGRARLVLLAETVGAMETLPACAAVDGVDEVHIGLNDLSLDLGLPFLFQPLARGFVDGMAAAVHAAGKPLGIGGIARADEGALPAKMILGEHARLGSSAVILSRTFHRRAMSVEEIERDMDFALEVAKLRAAFAELGRADDATLEANRRAVADRVEAIAAGLAPR